MNAKDKEIAALREYLRYALDWIDAVPAGVVSRLPAMPGFERDKVEMLLSDAELYLECEEEKDDD